MTHAESHGRLVPPSPTGQGVRSGSPPPPPVCPSGLGQLLVWEWQSESYVLKQQGHFNSMVSLAYSPDGQYIVTGGDDGKVGCVASDVGWSAVRECGLGGAVGSCPCPVGRGTGARPQLWGSAPSLRAHIASSGLVRKHIQTYWIGVGGVRVSP